MREIFVGDSLGLLNVDPSTLCMGESNKEIQADKQIIDGYQCVGEKSLGAQGFQVHP